VARKRLQSRKEIKLTAEKAEALRRFGIDAEDFTQEAIVNAFRERRVTHQHRSLAMGKNGEPAFISRPYLAPLGPRSANASRIRSAVKEVVSTKATHKVK